MKRAVNIAQLLAKRAEIIDGLQPDHRIDALFSELQRLTTRERDLEGVLFDTIATFAPMNWYESADSMQILERVLAILPARRATQLREWLCNKENR